MSDCVLSFAFADSWAELACEMFIYIAYSINTKRDKKLVLSVLILYYADYAQF